MSRAPGPPSAAGLLPSKLRYALWRRVDRRLQRGEVLITAEHYQQAMEVEFRRLVRVAPSARVREAIGAMVAAVNEEHPQTYMSLGIRNAITGYLGEMMAQLQGRPADAVEEVQGRLRQLVKDGRTAFFLESIGVEVGPRGLLPSVEQTIRRMILGTPVTEEDASAAARRRRAPRAAAPAGPSRHVLPDEQESRERVRAVHDAEAAMVDEELAGAPDRLGFYAGLGSIAADEAAALREYLGIDARVARGEVGRAEGERLRAGLRAGLPPGWEERLRQAVDPVVRCRSAVDFLRRLPASLDEVLRLLIRHQDLVNSDDAGADMGPVLQELEGHEELLVALTGITERREQEVRMIAANLPPYRYLLERGSVAPHGIEEDLVAELRALDRAALAARLSGADPEAFSDILSSVSDLVRLIGRAASPTRFHRAVRRLRVRQTIAELFAASADGRAGRWRVQQYLSQRVQRIYPDMSQQEHSDLLREAEALMASLEQQISRDGGARELRYYRA